MKRGYAVQRPCMVAYPPHGGWVTGACVCVGGSA